MSNSTIWDCVIDSLSATKPAPEVRCFVKGRLVPVDLAVACGAVEKARLAKVEWDDCGAVTDTCELEDVALHALAEEAVLAQDMTIDELPQGEGYVVQVLVAGEWGDVFVSLPDEDPSGES